MPTDGYVTVQPGLRLYYRWLGSARENPVVVPAAAWWGRQLDPLAGRRAVLVYDPRGRGRSDPRPESGGGLDAELDDLDRLRQELQLDRMSLIGWSYLGAIVALYAARHPERIQRLVQVGPMVPRREPYWQQFIADYGARAPLAAAASSTTSAASSVWEPAIAPQLADPAMARQILATLDLTSPHEDPAKIGAWAAKAMGGAGAWDWRGEAAKVTAPVLTVHGVRDNLPVEASREWVRSFPDARLLLIEGAGHYPHFEQSDTFIAAVSTFLDGAWPPGATAEPQ